MVTIVAWVFVGVMVVMPLLRVLVGVAKDRRLERQPTTAEDFQVLRDLYAIRRRFDVAWFKVAQRRDAAEARRALCDELDKLNSTGGNHR